MDEVHMIGKAQNDKLINERMVGETQNEKDVMNECEVGNNNIIMCSTVSVHC